MLSDYVYDNDFDGFDEGQYMLDLVECAPDIDTLLERVKQGMIYRGFVASTKYNTGVSLKEAEVKMMVDPTHVPWDAFHTGLLHSIFDNRASNKTNAATCTRSHSDEKMRLMQELHEAYPSSLSNLTDHRKQTWRSGVDALAVDFIREFENIVVKGGGDILKEIEKVLGKKWEPTDDEHARTIYYVCGAVLRMAENTSNDKTEEYASTYAALKSNASTTKEAAREAGLPYERVDDTEAVSLIYPTKAFYQVMLKIESVFHNILGEDNVLLFGVGIVGDIVHMLCKMDVGFAQLLPDAEEGAITAVYQRVLDMYGNTRGKDFACKRNAKHGASKTETTRATLGTIEQLNHLKKAKRAKEAKQKKEAEVETTTAAAKKKKKKSKSATEQSNGKSSDDVSKQSEAVSSGEKKKSKKKQSNGKSDGKAQVDDEFSDMKVQDLKVELGKRRLAVSGRKADLLGRLRDAVISNADNNNKSTGKRAAATASDDGTDTVKEPAAKKKASTATKAKKKNTTAKAKEKSNKNDDSITDVVAEYDIPDDVLYGGNFVMDEMAEEEELAMQGT